jgi:hypothetical protein
MNGRDYQDDSYRKVLHIDGTRITLSDHKFELSATPRNEVWEQQAVQMFREWIRWRKRQEELRELGPMSR